MSGLAGSLSGSLNRPLGGQGNQDEPEPWPPRGPGYGDVLHIESTGYIRRKNNRLVLPIYCDSKFEAIQYETVYAFTIAASVYKGGAVDPDTGTISENYSPEAYRVFEQSPFNDPDTGTFTFLWGISDNVPDIRLVQDEIYQQTEVPQALDLGYAGKADVTFSIRRHYDHTQASAIVEEWRVRVQMPIRVFGEDSVLPDWGPELLIDDTIEESSGG